MTIEPWFLSAQSPTGDQRWLGAQGEWWWHRLWGGQGGEAARNGTSPCSPKLCHKLRPPYLPGQQTPAEWSKTPGPQEAPVGLLASSSQPGLDTYLLHFFSHWGWGRQLQYELCSHWGLGETWLEENKYPTPPLPTQVPPSLVSRRNGLLVFSLSPITQLVLGYAPRFLH